jgi:hypothetical protein
MARIQTETIFAHAADRSIQFHRGFGFTYDCDAQLYRRRALWKRVSEWRCDLSAIEQLATYSSSDRLVSQRACLMALTARSSPILDGGHRARILEPPPPQSCSAHFASRKASPIEALEAVLARVARHNPVSNALPVIDIETARRDARASEGAMDVGRSSRRSTASLRP